MPYLPKLLIHKAKSVHLSLVNLLLPVRCVGCKKKNTWLCYECTDLKDPISKEHAIALCRNSRHIRQLLSSLKNKGAYDSANRLAELLHDQCTEIIAEHRSFHPGNTISISYCQSEPHLELVTSKLAEITNVHPGKDGDLVVEICENTKYPESSEYLRIGIVS